LASYPGPGYTRTLQYDDAGNLASITRDYGSYTELAFEYQTGFDGKRRWKKDHTTEGEPEYWYPCGVACCAGELVTLISMDNGDTWQTHRTFVRGAIGTAFINYELQLSTGAANVAMYDSSMVTVQVNDSFGLARSTPYPDAISEWMHENNDENYLIFVQSLGPSQIVDKPCEHLLSNLHERKIAKDILKCLGAFTMEEVLRCINRMGLKQLSDNFFDYLACLHVSSNEGPPGQDPCTMPSLTHCQACCDRNTLANLARCAFRRPGKHCIKEAEKSTKNCYLRCVRSNRR
jgi:hypothetical protein